MIETPRWSDVDKGGIVVQEITLDEHDTKTRSIIDGTPE